MRRFLFIIIALAFNSLVLKALPKEDIWVQHLTNRFPAVVDQDGSKELSLMMGGSFIDGRAGYFFRSTLHFFLLGLSANVNDDAESRSFAVLSKLKNLLIVGGHAHDIIHLGDYRLTEEDFLFIPESQKELLREKWEGVSVNVIFYDGLLNHAISTFIEEKEIDAANNAVIDIDEGVLASVKQKLLADRFIWKDEKEDIENWEDLTQSKQLLYLHRYMKIEKNYLHGYLHPEDYSLQLDQEVVFSSQRVERINEIFEQSHLMLHGYSLFRGLETVVGAVGDHVARIQKHFEESGEADSSELTIYAGITVEEKYCKRYHVEYTGIFNVKAKQMAELVEIFLHDVGKTLAPKFQNAWAAYSEKILSQLAKQRAFLEAYELAAKSGGENFEAELNQTKEKGNEAFKSGDSNLALAFYKLALKIAGERKSSNVNAEKAKVYLNMARCFLKLEEYAQCVVHCNKALILDRGSENALIVRAHGHYKRKDFQAALADAEELLKKDGKHEEALKLKKAILQAKDAQKLKDQEIAKRMFGKT